MSDRPRYAVASLDQIEQLPGPDTLRWRPVRGHFDLRAFGTNAYTATEVGQDLIERHTEDPQLSHEELYFVFEGRARFELDGEVIEAPAGTYVFVRDVGVERYASAAEVPTTVLSFGGPPTFEPSAWEWAFRGDARLAAGEVEAARTTLAEGLEHHPDSPGLHWSLAYLAIADGDHDRALDELATAIAIEPAIAEEFPADEDLAPLREHPRFKELTAPAP